jgi:hypothetical protein
METLAAEDDMTLIIRGHLVLEVLLNRLIVLATPPASEELDRLWFNQKLDVAIALGALSPDVRAGWRQVNTLRNRFAHDLRAELTQADADDLLNGMPAELRASIQDQRRLLDLGDEGGHRTPRALAAICIGCLATFASRAVVERGGSPIKSTWPSDEA